MSEAEKQDHWADLLSELGVEAPVEEASQGFAQMTSGATPLAPAVEPESEPFPRPSYQPPPRELRQTPQDWRRLARELGIEVPAEEVPPEPVKQEPSPATLLPPPQPRAAEEAPGRIEYPEGGVKAVQAETDRADADLWEGAVEGPTAPREEADKRLRRRRKRRRKTRPAEAVPLKAEHPRAEPDSVEPADFVEVVEILQEEEEIEEIIPTEATAEVAPKSADSEPAAKRSKRRRHRRFGRKKTAGSEGEAPEPDEVLATESADGGADADELEDSDDEMVGTGDYDHQADKRMLHRGIPTWREAIGVVISANLEARSKRTDRGVGPRGRGNRGGVVKEKPEQSS